MHMLKKILEITKPYWPRIFAGILLSIAVSGITGAMVCKPAIDEEGKKYSICTPFDRCLPAF
jgi:hypothetical protein